MNQKFDSFHNKVVVVTGASRGIGRAIAAAFAGERAHVVLVAHSAENLSLAAREISAASGQSVVTCASDLRTEAGCAKVAALVQETFGRCDILVNSAGATHAGAFLDLPDDTWADGFALKFFACVRMCRLLWPMLSEITDCP